MACKCEKCGLITTCGERYCNQCLIDECFKTDTDKNIYSGGRFYGVELEKENDDKPRY